MITDNTLNKWASYCEPTEKSASVDELWAAAVKQASIAEVLAKAVGRAGELVHNSGSEAKAGIEAAIKQLHPPGPAEAGNVLGYTHPGMSLMDQFRAIGVTPDGSLRMRLGEKLRNASSTIGDNEEQVNNLALGTTGGIGAGLLTGGAIRGAHHLMKDVESPTADTTPVPESPANAVIGGSASPSLADRIRSILGGGKPAPVKSASVDELWADVVKEADAAGLAVKGIEGLGGILRNWGGAAKKAVGVGKFAEEGGELARSALNGESKLSVMVPASEGVAGGAQELGPDALKALRSSAGAAGNDAAKLVGNHRIDWGNKLLNLSKNISGDAALQGNINKGVNIAGASAGVAGVGGIAHHMGVNSGKADGLSEGRTQGLEQGAGQGYDAGVQAGAQSASADPGVMSRLMEVFTGRQSNPTNPGDPMMQMKRHQTLQHILSGGQ